MITILSPIKDSLAIHAVKLGLLFNSYHHTDTCCIVLKYQNCHGGVTSRVQSLACSGQSYRSQALPGPRDSGGSPGGQCEEVTVSGGVIPLPGQHT